MLRRTLHLRFALLSLLAAMLLVVVPTLTPVSMQHGATDASMQMGASARAMHDAHLVAQSQVQPHGGRARHDDGACAYCPLLAGLLQWTAPAFPAAPPPRAVARSAVAVPARAASTRRDSLGARGPPARRAA